MKRASVQSEDTQPPGREKLFRRQEPVSCEFCRRKKLKCDRGAPCSNCRARKLTCSSSESVRLSSDNVSEQVAHSAHGNNEDLNARVKRLEALLAKNEFSKSFSHNHHTSSTPCTCASPKHNQNGTSPTGFPAQPANPTPGDIEYNKTVSWLETDAFEHQPHINETPATTACAELADSFGSFLFSMTRPRIAPVLNQHLLAVLPARARAKILFDYYINNINWTYHIIHVPTVEKHFAHLYDSLERGQAPELDVLALIASLLALCAYSAAPSTNLFNNHADAMISCRRWVMLVQDALSASDCLAKPTIESLQSLILIAQHLMPNIGAISTLRILSGSITHAARLMQLHQTDSPANKRRRQNTQVDWVEIETKRRLWWHITSTDWIMSFMGGSQCGTYAISPNQMYCDWPANVDDTAIDLSGKYAQPLHILTDMTYFVIRIRFSITFRSIVDQAWESGSDLDDLPYEIVLECDKRLNDLVAELETTFQTVRKQKSDAASSEPMVERKLLLLRRQRDMGLFGIHTRISRLHRGFLIRGAQDPRYAYSRMVCLRSARTVIEIGKRMAEGHDNMPGMVSIKLWTLNHHLFVSIVILVMDYCFNKDEPRQEERKKEILECFSLIDAEKDKNTIAYRGLRNLKEVLKKLPGSGCPETSGSGEEIRDAPDTSMKANLLPVVTQTLESQAQAFVPESMFAQTEHVSTAPPPYQPYSPWDNTFDEFNFDMNVDASQFEALFQFEDSNVF